VSALLNKKCLWVETSNANEEYCEENMSGKGRENFSLNKNLRK
jgi:hypothetical protein